MMRVLPLFLLIAACAGDDSASDSAGDDSAAPADSDDSADTTDSADSADTADSAPDLSSYSGTYTGQLGVSCPRGNRNAANLTVTLTIDADDAAVITVDATYLDDYPATSFATPAGDPAEYVADLGWSVSTQIIGTTQGPDGPLNTTTDYALTVNPTTVGLNAAYSWDYLEPGVGVSSCNWAGVLTRSAGS